MVIYIDLSNETIAPLFENQECINSRVQAILLIGFCRGQVLKGVDTEWFVYRLQKNHLDKDPGLCLSVV